MRPDPRVCGYPARAIGDRGEYEMREISFGLPPSALRDVGRFLLSVADEVESGAFKHRIYWHRHIDESVPDWREKYPSLDIVVVDLDTY
jgi:hypothetical protein